MPMFPELVIPLSSRATAVVVELSGIIVVVRIVGPPAAEAEAVRPSPEFWFWRQLPTP